MGYMFTGILLSIINGLSVWLMSHCAQDAI